MLKGDCVPKETSMNCLNTMAPGDEDILKYVCDEVPLSQEARTHIKQCPTCQQRLASYKDINAFLVSSLYRHQCPDSMQLSLYCAGEVVEEEHVQITAHLRKCPLCAQEVADTRRFLTDTELTDGPVDTLEDTVRRIVAALQLPQPSLTVRNTVKATGWPRQYRAEAYSLLLDLSADKQEKYTLIGTLTHLNDAISLDVFEGKEVELHLLAEHDQLYRPVTSTQIDDMGSFVLHAIPTGTYRLLVNLDDCELEVDDLPITASQRVR
jgi:hypothetical protein